MPCLAFRAAAMVLALTAFSVPAAAQVPGAVENPGAHAGSGNSANTAVALPGITAKLHPWGRFEPGSWRLVRVVTETFNEQGQVISTNTTDTHTTLLDIDNEGVTLEIESCIEVAGKRFQADPQVVKQGFHGEMAGPNVIVKESSDSEIEIDEAKIPCKVQQLEIVGPNGKTNVVLHYSTDRAPFLLKREAFVTDPDGKTILSRTGLEVTQLDMPVRIRGSLCNGAYVKTVYRNEKSRVTTLAVTSQSVPGGVVSHSMKEVDRNGRLIRRSTLELLDYDSTPDNNTGLLGRKRPPRRTKQPPRYSP